MCYAPPGGAYNSNNVVFKPCVILRFRDSVLEFCVIVIRWNPRGMNHSNITEAHSNSGREAAREYSGKTKQIRGELQYKYYERGKFAGIFWIEDREFQ